MGINAGNGPLPIPCGMKTPDVKVSVFPFLVTFTVSVPLAVADATGT